MSKQNILIEAVQALTAQTPDVPITPGIDVKALTKPDIDAGREPFFVILPLSHTNQVSRNFGRIYRGEVANNAIYQAITQRKIGGNTGHTPQHLAGSFFEIPVVHWVGALIVPETGVTGATGKVNVCYGKCYVPGDSPRMQELRGYYQRQAAVGGNVGTSLEGIGIEIYDPELDSIVIEALEIHKIDVVSGDMLTGIPLAGSRTPVITTEQFNEEFYMKEQLEKAQADFRNLVEAISKHNDFKDILYRNSTPASIIEAVQRTVAFKESPIEVFVIPGQQRRDTSEQIDYSVLMPTPKNDSWFEIPTGEA